MFFQQIAAVCALAVTSIVGVSAAPHAKVSVKALIYSFYQCSLQGTPTYTPCSSATTVTTTYSGFVIPSPGTSYPYTTTVTYTDVEYPARPITDRVTETFTLTNGKIVTETATEIGEEYGWCTAN